MGIFNGISLLGGLALFLYGMRIMGDNLKKNSGGTMQHVLGKVTDNPFKAFLLGLLVTALIQSSTATIVLVAGLVAADVLDSKQSVGIVLGANVGTTVTGQIIRLLDLNTSGSTAWLTLFKPATLAPLAALLGILFIMFIKTRNSNSIGEIAMGFGILFTGLINMSAAVEPLSESPSFIAIFTRFSGLPVLGFLCGLLVSTIVQSSSASVGMLQTLSTTGVLTFSSIYPILIGIYVGDALTTAIVCSIGTRSGAKRTGMITLLFNVFSIAFLMIGVAICHKIGIISPTLWSGVMTSGSIANVNTIFKLTSALACVPATNLFYKAALRIVKDNKVEGNILLDAVVKKLDIRLLPTPSVALSSVNKVLAVMMRMAMTNTLSSLALFDKFDAQKVQEINESEDCIDHMADAVNDYLLRLSANVKDEKDSDMVNYYMQCYTEVERIGDLAINICENTEALAKHQTAFSAVASSEMDKVQAALGEIMDDVTYCCSEQEKESAEKVEPLEEIIDEMVEDARKRHLLRLRDGSCTSEVGLIFEDALTNIERISDHCSNIAVYCLALTNKELQHNRHEYMRRLHNGENPAYNAEYQRQREVYLQT